MESQALKTSAQSSQAQINLIIMHIMGTDDSLQYHHACKRMQTSLLYSFLESRLQCMELTLLKKKRNSHFKYKDSSTCTLNLTQTVHTRNRETEREGRRQR